MSEARLWLTLLLALGCGPGDENTVERGQHIDLEIEAGLEPCGDLVGHMDRFLELVAAEWSVDLSERHYGYRWLTQATYLAESDCAKGTLGCAMNGKIDAYAAPVDHELVHVVTGAIGVPPSFFIEGAAVAFELPVLDNKYHGFTVTPIDAALLTSTRLPGYQYQLAGAYTRHLIDRFGMAAYREFYGSIERSADIAAITAAHAAAFGEPLDDTTAAFAAERSGCAHERFRFKLFECAAPILPWEADSLTLTRELSCADDDVAGPFYNDQATTYASFEVADAGLFELSMASDERFATVTLGSCGGCESPGPVEVSANLGPHRLNLDPGRYYLRLKSAVDTTTLLSLRLRRVDAPTH